MEAILILGVFLAYMAVLITISISKTRIDEILKEEQDEKENLSN